MLYRFKPTEITQDERKIRGLACPVWDGSSGSEYQIGSTVVERFAPDSWDYNNCFCFFNHDRSKPLGKTPETLRVWTDKKGLHFEVSLPEVSFADDILILVKSKIVTGASIRFLPKKVKWSKEGGLDICLIQKCEVTELGPVTEPCYSNTQLSARGFSDYFEQRLREIELELSK